jgi:elongator complex protein 2
MRLWKESEGKWSQKVAVGGCIKSVKGISWSENGEYLVSVSLDQTTRLFGEWKTDGKKSWHEFARPQIHGYDLNAVSTLKDWKYVSGADEKVLRVFQSSKTTADLINRLSNLNISTDVDPFRMF